MEFFENSWKIPRIPLGKTNGFACWTKVLCAIWWYVSDKPNPSMNSKEFLTENVQEIKEKIAIKWNLFKNQERLGDFITKIRD